MPTNRLCLWKSLTIPALIVLASPAPAQVEESETLEESASVSHFVVSEEPEGLKISDGELPVLFYQATRKSLDGKFSRAHYVHPLYGLDGRELTEDFPKDHQHHRGVFWAWHQLYVGEESVGDAWMCRDFEWEPRSADVVLANGLAVLTAASVWKSPDLTIEGQQAAIVRDAVVITVRPVEGDLRVVDFDILLTALVDGVKIGGSDDVKGYGGFSPRLIDAQLLSFRGRGGEVEPQKTAVEAGPWLDFAYEDRGLTVIQHPENPPPADRWILRRGGSMQNAMFPGRDPISLPRDKPLRLRYRLLIHRGEVSTDVIERQFELFRAQRQASRIQPDGVFGF